MIRKLLKISYSLIPFTFKPYVIDVFRFAGATINNSTNIQSLKFYNKHKSVCVLGNGPSLKNDKEELFTLKNQCDFISVNNFCDDDLYATLKPKLYILLDPYFFSSLAHPDWIVRRNKTFEILNTKTTWDMQLIVPFHADLNNIKTFIKNSNIKIVKVSAQNLFSKKFSILTKTMFNSGIWAPPRVNVLIYAIYLGILANYEVIRVFGADLSFHNDVKVDQRTNEVYMNIRHFNEPDKIELLRKNPGKVEPYRMSELLDTSAKTFYTHEVLYKYAMSKGIKIINHSRFSLIDAYPRNKNF